jgi:CRISPR-associated protein Cas1
MPKRDFYITESGTVRRKQNTIWFENANTKKAIPVEKISSLYCLGEVTINSKLLTFLAKKGIMVHFFNYYGYYTGTFYPKETLVSGSLVVKQVKHYSNYDKRIKIAKEFVKATQQNLIRILEHYRKHGKNVKNSMEKIEMFSKKVDSLNQISEIMNKEGLAWKEYFSTYEQILSSNFKFESRTKRPPENEINCLISFLNSLLYTKTLSEIYHTQLVPTISYLHEPFERRFSLALDLSEMFKPLITQRAMLKLVNKQEIKQKHFRSDVKGCMLNSYGRKIVLKEFDRRMRKTVKHPSLKRSVSYQRLIRLEAYKLIKHLVGEKPYEAFRIWW